MNCPICQEKLEKTCDNGVRCPKMIPIERNWSVPCFEIFNETEHAVIYPFKIVTTGNISFIYHHREHYPWQFLAQMPKIDLSSPEIILPKLKALLIFS